MSATNRGSKRIKSDFYITPSKSVRAFLENWYALDGLTILEPSAGNGSICKVIKDIYPESYIIANEIRTEENDNLKKYADEVYNEDFINPTISMGSFDIIIGNPPYNKAQEFLEQCFKLAGDYADVVMLLRLAFLESKKRHDFWQKHPLKGLYVLSERPSFINGKTDATAYGWFVWRKSCIEKTIEVI